MMKISKTMWLMLCFSAGLMITAQAQSARDWAMKSIPIQSRWAKEVSPTNALKEYPRPQLQRKNWQNLNGLWDYAVTKKDSAQPAKYEGQILVPYPIESALSGVKRSLKPDQDLWYQRTFTVQAVSGTRTLLHFGAVDWQSTVFINGKEAGSHTGGYTEFTLDITDKLRPGNNELMVKVYDPTDQGIGPHGKQVLNPKDIYYTPTSGIWQTVWLETVPQNYIAGLTITPDIDKGVVNITVNSAANEPVQLMVSGKTVKGKSNSPIQLPLQGAAGLKLWSPANPYLYDLTVKLGKDEVTSYFGMRKISIGKDEKGMDRIFLNNKPYYNLGTLDQGFWPDGLYTAPTDEALAFDIKAIKAMGFNTIRKHIKVEPARWYYWADKLGMLVWQDMVNPNQGLPEGAKPAFEQQCKETLAQLHNYPCITTWVLFNEKWGQYDQQRLTEWIKTTDPSRIVNGHTGELLYVNEQLRSPSPNAYVSADMTDVHSYPFPMNSIRQPGKARVCGEFGGIGVFIPDHQWNTSSAWGYIQEKPAGLKAKYTVMNQDLQLMEKDGLSGSIYTQPFDVEGEQNGLMTYDREVVKIPFAELRKIHAPLNRDANTNIPEVSAKDADLSDPVITYSQLLQRYLDGDREPVFLAKMTMAGAQAGDKFGASKAAKDYMATLTPPYTKDQLHFVLQNVASVNDPGFAILQQQLDAPEGMLNKRAVTVKMMNLIYGEVMDPLITGQKAPDWDAIAAKIKPYGAAAEEILLRAKTVDYYYKQDWKNYVPVARAYLAKYSNGLTDQEKSAFQTAIDEHQ